ncbi:MAG: helix-turn-helix transcriptional regulator [Actinomycetaceae bacterium]|nr:helix-turn-helix transcriptional regulator [Actinomycetaceae bacterium]
MKTLKTNVNKPAHTRQAPPPLLRHEIGDVLRMIRQSQGRTLREVSAQAQVSLGYLSEVERGQKEASSELLLAICAALDLPMSTLLHEVADRFALAEGVVGLRRAESLSLSA